MKRLTGAFELPINIIEKLMSPICLESSSSESSTVPSPVNVTQKAKGSDSPRSMTSVELDKVSGIITDFVLEEVKERIKLENTVCHSLPGEVELPTEICKEKITFNVIMDELPDETPTRPSCIESIRISLKKKMDQILGFFQRFYKRGKRCFRKPRKLF